MGIWLPCRLIRQDTGKIDKVPFNYKTGASKYTAEDGTWITTDFATALEAARKDKRPGNLSNGVGIHLGRGVVAFDFDAALRGNVAHEWAEKALKSMEGAYVEASVSGTGLKVYVRCEGAPTGRPKTEDFGPGETHNQHIMYLGSGFNHVTGATVQASDWAAWTPSVLEQVCRELSIGLPKADRAEGEVIRSVYHTGDVEKDTALALECLRRIPNDRLDWEWWNQIGMATWAASQGSDAGRDAFVQWSDSNPSANRKTTIDRWRHWSRSPPRMLTVGRLVREAKQHDPAFDPPRPRPVVAPRHVSEWGDIDFNDLHLSSIIDGIIFDGSLSILYGAFGSGKSFFAVYLAVMVALGREVFGRKVSPTNVLYIAAEAENSIKRRLKAYEIDEPGILTTPGRRAIHVMAPPIDLFGDPDKPKQEGDWAEITEVVRVKEVGLVIIDTFAQALGAGNENTAQDQMRVVRFCNRLRQETGAAVMFVHHTGKDASKGMRGGTALAAAAEEHVFVEDLSNQETGEKVHRATVNRSKDTAGEQEMYFDLAPVKLMVTEEGTEITSCVVAPRLEAPEGELKGRTSGGAPPVSRAGRTAGSSLKGRLLALVKEKGEVTRKDAQAIISAQMGGRPVRGDSLRRAVKDLVDAKHITAEGEYLFSPK